MECGYKNSVEVHGVCCTKDCYYPRSYIIWKKAGLYTHRFVVSIVVCKHSMDLTSEVNV